MRWKPALFLMCFFSLSLGMVSAFPLQIGVKGGVPLIDNYELEGGYDTNHYASKTNRYTIGPVIEMQHLPLHLSLEFDALYRRLHYNKFSYSFSPGSGGSQTYVTQYASNRWEFPLLLKYRFSTLHQTFYVSVGPTVNYLAERKSATTSTIINPYFPPPGVSPTGTSTSSAFELKRVSTGGVVVGGGYNFHFGFFRVSPELRYTRWVNRNFEEPKWWLGPSLKSNQNQLDFLLGVTF